MILKLKNIEQEYLKVIERASSALFFHHPAYLKLLSEHLRATPLVLFFENASCAIAMPLLLKEGLKGKVLNSLPYFGSNGSFIVIGTNETEIKKLKQSAIVELEEWCKNEQIISSNIVTNYFNQNEKDWYSEYYQPDFTSVRYGQVTELPPFTEDYDKDLLTQFQDPRPRNIRKAINSGVKIRKAQSESDWGFLYEVHKDNMQSIGAPVKDRSFFDLVQKHIPQEFYTLYIAEIESQPVSCMLVFHAFLTVEYYTPGTLTEFRNQQPSALLVFEAMKEFAAQGYKYWNWGGSSSRESGVYDFKKRWGAVEMPYYHLTRIYNPNIYKSTAKELMEQYPGFFVVPFNQLKHAEN